MFKRNWFPVLALVLVVLVAVSGCSSFKENRYAAVVDQIGEITSELKLLDQATSDTDISVTMVRNRHRQELNAGGAPWTVWTRCDIAKFLRFKLEELQREEARLKVEIESEKKAEQLVEWGLPSDGHAGHACHGTPVNGLVRAQDCHGGHFCGRNGGRILLPAGQTPTTSDYLKVVNSSPK